MNDETVTPGDKDDSAEFDRIYALDDEAGESQPAGGTKQGGGGEAAPAQAAGESAPPSTGGQAASGDKGASGGESATQSPGATGTTPQQQAQQAEDDWLSALPGEVQSKIKAERDKYQQERQQLEDRYKALHGRLTPTQQQLADAQRRLAQYQSQPQQPATVQQPDPGKTTPSPLDSFYDSPGWKKYAQDYPGDAEVLRAGLDAQHAVSRQQLEQLSATVNQLTQRLGQTEQVASRSVVNDELAKLEAAHPDWNELNHSEEYWEWFDSWRSKQPKSLRDQYYDPKRLEVLMMDSEFLIARLSEYKAETQQKQAATQPAATTTTQTTQSESTQPTQQQQAPQQQQQDVRVRMGVAPEVRGGSPMTQTVSLDGMPESEQFDYLFAQEP